MHPSVPVVVAALLLAAVVAFLISRPRLLWNVALFPFVLLVAGGQIFRTCLHFPANLTKWLAYSVTEKEASALRHHAETASLLASAGPEYEPAARELLSRVLAGYGIRPPHTRDVDDLPLAPQEDAFHAAARRGAAEAITNSRGKAAAAK